MRIFRVTGLVLLVVLTSCFPFRRGSEADTPAVASVVLTNLNDHDAEVYRMADGGRTLLGVVPGGTSATLQAVIPPSRQMSIEVRLVEVGSYRSWAVVVSPRTPIELEVPADLHLIRGRFD